MRSHLKSLFAFNISLFICIYSLNLAMALETTNERLPKCPSKPNCVCSEYSDDEKHYVLPIIFSDDIKPSLSLTLKDIISDMGGTVESQNHNYIAATFSSSMFKFIDDFELRIDQENNTIHIRSASRTGHYDFGANKKRVKLFRKSFKQRTTESH